MCFHCTKTNLRTKQLLKIQNSYNLLILLGVWKGFGQSFSFCLVFFSRIFPSSWIVDIIFFIILWSREKILPPKFYCKNFSCILLSMPQELVVGVNCLNKLKFMAPFVPCLIRLLCLTWYAGRFISRCYCLIGNDIIGYRLLLYTRLLKKILVVKDYSTFLWFLKTKHSH